MLSKRFAVTMISIAGLAALLVAQTGGPGSTPPTASATNQTIEFPVLGLANSETAEIDVVNVAAASSSGAAASCSGTIVFYSSSGAAIAAGTSFTVAGGQVLAASMPFSQTGAAAARTLIRGEIKLTGDSSAPCTLNASFQTYDTPTGVTHAVVSGSAGSGAAGPGGAVPGGAGGN